jgi:hypothetical protein
MATSDVCGLIGNFDPEPIHGFGAKPRCSGIIRAQLMRCLSHDCIYSHKVSLICPVMTGLTLWSKWWGNVEWHPTVTQLHYKDESILARFAMGRVGLFDGGSNRRNLKVHLVFSLGEKLRPLRRMASL